LFKWSENINNYINNLFIITAGYSLQLYFHIVAF
jgi:hypothetical protein